MQLISHVLLQPLLIMFIIKRMQDMFYIFKVFLLLQINLHTTRGLYFDSKKRHFAMKNVGATFDFLKVHLMKLLFQPIIIVLQFLSRMTPYGLIIPSLMLTRAPLSLLR